jgi:hypothetical protein
MTKSWLSLEQQLPNGRVGVAHNNWPFVVSNSRAISSRSRRLTSAEGKNKTHDKYPAENNIPFFIRMSLRGENTIVRSAKITLAGGACFNLDLN